MFSSFLSNCNLHYYLRSPFQWHPDIVLSWLSTFRGHHLKLKLHLLPEKLQSLLSGCKSNLKVLLTRPGRKTEPMWAYSLWLIEVLQLYFIKRALGGDTGLSGEYTCPTGNIRACECANWRVRVCALYVHTEGAGRESEAGLPWRGQQSFQSHWWHNTFDVNRTYCSLRPHREYQRAGK